MATHALIPRGLILDRRLTSFARQRYQDGHNRAGAVFNAPLREAANAPARAILSGPAPVRRRPAVESSIVAPTTPEPGPSDAHAVSEDAPADDIDFVVGGGRDLAKSSDLREQDPARYVLFQARDPGEAGEKFASTQSGLDVDAAAAALARMGPAERGLFRRAYARKLMDQLRRAADCHDVLTKAFVTARRARQNIELVLGSRGARRLEARLRLEAIGQRSRQGLSCRKRELPLGQAIAGAMLSAGGRTIDAKTARYLAELVAAGEPSKLRTAAAAAATSRNLMDAVRRTHARLRASDP
jgi:hypothetical protein